MTSVHSRLLTTFLLRTAGAVLLAAGVASGGAELSAVRTNGPVAIDGRLDEKIWARARPTGDFVGPLQPDGTVLPAKSGARVRAAWDETTIYLAFECDGAPGPATLREHDAPLHTQEVVEVFLDFTGEGTDYVELQVSPAGVTADLFHHWSQRPSYPATRIDEAQRRTLKSEWAWNVAGLAAAAAIVQENGVVRGWTAEIALPIASLSREPRPGLRLSAGQAFRANFVHYRYESGGTGKPVLQQATWGAVLEGKPHISPMAMGSVRCVLPPSGEWAPAWRDASRLLVQDAYRSFSQAKTVSRESRFGEAVALLNVQPKTEGNIERAHTLLEALAAENGADEFGLMAGYYLGRIEEAHRTRPDLPRALAYYDALLQAHPAELFAQLAAVKACVLRLYATENARPAAERLARAEALAPIFTEPEARRDYHLVMADAIARLGGTAEDEIRHSLAAEAAGHLDRTGRANIDLRVAELSRGLGRKDRAIEYYRKFLTEYTREVRVFLVQQRLKELEAQP